MSTISLVKYSPGAVAKARVEHHPVQMIAPRLVSSDLARVPPAEGAPAAVSAAKPAPAPAEGSAWDPHEVWLTRVKQPREQRSS